MAPRKTAVVPAFAEADIIAIDAEYEADGDVPVEGAETEVMAGDIARAYKYTNGTWVYMHSKKDGVEFDECKKSKAKGKKKEETVTSDSETDSRKQKATKKTDTNKKPEVDIVAKVRTDSDSEHSDTEVPLSKAKESIPKKTKKKVTKEAKSLSDTSEVESDASQKPKKSRKGVTLDDVMESLVKLDINEAKTKLASFISKHGAEGKSKRTRKVAVDENGEPIARPQTAYSKFMSENLKRLNAEQNAKIESGKLKIEDKVSPKDLLREVSKLWQAQKTQ